MPPSWQQAFCYFACLPRREHIKGFSSRGSPFSVSLSEGTEKRLAFQKTNGPSEEPAASRFIR